MLTLSDARRSYKPKIPQLLAQPLSVAFQDEKKLPVSNEISPLFSHTSALSVVSGHQGRLETAPLRIGVAFSGGPAPGGHNVISGLFDTLQKMGKHHSMIGFLGGPGAIVSGNFRELKSSDIDHYRNQGGFDLLGSGRTKIETPDQFKSVLDVVTKLKLDGLVIIGGDDSNTNAALLAEYFLKHNASTRVIGVPKTIDGDIQNPYVPISFGFDTAAKVYSELIGNLARDTLSSLKYFHFVKLMGRSASHLTLECALKTHPNITLITEEKKPLQHIVQELANFIEQRAAKKTPYGMILIPEGLLEVIPDIPPAILAKLLLDKDSHGNVNVSAIETEKLLMELVQEELSRRNFSGPYQPLGHFYGYEGRCGHPSNFDANYSYALGCTTALLIAHRYTGMMAYVNNLHLPPSDWTFGGVPLAPLLVLSERKGTLKPVIDKALIDFKSAPYKRFLSHRMTWKNHSDYESSGPIQFAGDVSLTDSCPLILQ